VQALGPKTTVEGFDVFIVRRLPGPAEVKRYALGVGPKVEVPGDELRALVDPDRLGIADLRAHLFQRSNDVFGSVAESVHRAPVRIGRTYPQW